MLAVGDGTEGLNCWSDSCDTVPTAAAVGRAANFKPGGTPSLRERHTTGAWLIRRFLIAEEPRLTYGGDLGPNVLRAPPRH